MQITEPTTLITDYILAGLALYFGMCQWRLASAFRQKSIRLWSIAFFSLAIGAFVGGTSHGFKLYLSDFANQAIWKTTVYAIGVTSFCLFSGTVVATFSAAVQRWLLALAAIKLATYAVWMVSHDAFLYVVLDYAPAMLAVVGLQIYAYQKHQAASAPWLIAGIIISFVAAGVQVSGFSVHEHINHNDIYHIIQMAALYFLHRGITLIRDV